MKKSKNSVSRKRSNRNVIIYSGDVFACERKGNGWGYAANIKPANLTITATVEDWERFRKIVGREESLLTWSFQNVVNRVYSEINKNKSDVRGPNNAVLRQRSSYMLAALLCLFFEDRKKRDPLKETIRLMRLVYPEKKDVITTSDEDDKSSLAKDRFRIGYVNRGKKILRKITNKNDDELEYFNQLWNVLDPLIQAAKNEREKDDLVFMYNLVAASFVYFDRDTDYQWLSHPSLPHGYPSEHADRRFNEIRKNANRIFRDVTSWIK